jgi:hypothetical protein
MVRAMNEGNPQLGHAMADLRRFRDKMDRAD